MRTQVTQICIFTEPRNTVVSQGALSVTFRGGRALENEKINLVAVTSSVGVLRMRKEEYSQRVDV